MREAALRRRLRPAVHFGSQFLFNLGFRSRLYQAVGMFLWSPALPVSEANEVFGTCSFRSVRELGLSR